MATCRSHVLPTTSTTQWPTRETASRPTPLKCHSSWASPPSSLLSSFVSSWALIPTTLGGGMFQIQHIFYIFKIQTFKHRHSHLPLEKQKKLTLLYWRVPHPNIFELYLEALTEVKEMKRVLIL